MRVKGKTTEQTECIKAFHLTCCIQKTRFKGYHVLLLEVVEQLLHGGVAPQRGGGAHHQQLVLGSGDGHVQAAPVLQQRAQL